LNRTALPVAAFGAAKKGRGGVGVALLVWPMYTIGMGKRKLKRPTLAKKGGLNVEVTVLDKVVFSGPVDLEPLRPLAVLMKALCLEAERVADSVPPFVDLTGWAMLLPDEIPPGVRAELAHLDPWWTGFFARVDEERACDEAV
jgi:hypothetical protein